MPTASINGIELYYEVSGQGPPVVFAHGVGGNHASWWQQVSYFARWYQVVTFDHRGFGNSGDNPEGPGQSAFVDDLRGLLDHLGVPQAVLVAQSMGGGTCLGFTVGHPQRVRALVMADSLRGFGEPGPLDERVQEVQRATTGLSQLERVLSPGFRQRQPELTALYRQIASFNSATRTTLRGSLQSHTPLQLAEAKVPVLFLVGQEDVLFPPDLVRSVQQRVPGSSLVVVPDAGHSVYFEKPDVFNHQVHAFLDAAGVRGEP